jgi:hypothetical protein
MRGWGPTGSGLYNAVGRASLTFLARPLLCALSLCVARDLG